jgi:uncharacterized delta-60 repeat protein
LWDWFSGLAGARRPESRLGCRPRLEGLEERTLLSPGDLDPTFGNGGLVISDFPGFANVTATSVAVQPDGRVIVVGAASPSGGTGTRFALTRFNPDGSLDDSFGDGGRVTTPFPGVAGAGARGIAVQPDGRIVVAGGAGGAFALARYNSDGSLDTSFGTGGLVTTGFPGEFSANSIGVALQPDGRIVAAGETYVFKGPTRLVAARYNSDGSLDPSFGNGGRVDSGILELNHVYSVAVGGGHIVVGGDTGSRFLVVRYNDNGSLDQGFGTGGSVFTAFPGFDGSVGRSVAVLADGRILAAGGAFNRNPPYHAEVALARYAPDGSLDPTFGTGGLVTTSFGQLSASAYAMTSQRNGRIVLAGNAVPPDAGEFQFALARYDSDGTLDESFGADGRVTTPFPGYSRTAVSGVAVQPDGRIVATGSLSFGAPPRIGVARYEGDPVSATRFEVTAPTEVTAGQPFDVTVSAVDDNGNVVPDYAGTVTLSSTDPLAPALGNHTFTTADGGVFTFSAVQLFTAGPQSVSADDGNLSGQADLTVDPGLAVGLLLTGPDHATAGVPLVVTVSAVDAWGNVATGYTGTVWLEATDPDANLPDSWEFTADDAGTHQFTLTLNTPGPVRLTAHDTDAGWSADLDLIVA